MSILQPDQLTLIPGAFRWIGFGRQPEFPEGRVWHLLRLAPHTLALQRGEVDNSQQTEEQAINSVLDFICPCA